MFLKQIKLIMSSLFIVINKKIGGERKMTWDEVWEWVRYIMGLQ